MIQCTACRSQTGAVHNFPLVYGVYSDLPQPFLFSKFSPSNTRTVNWCSNYISGVIRMMESGPDFKMEEDVQYRGTLDPAQNLRLSEIRQSFHPSYIPSLFIAEEKGLSEVTFHLMNEDHTICNPLREVLNRHPGVLHVGYTIPHPSERKVAFVLRVRDGFTCQEVMRDGFKILMDIFDTLGKRFSEAVIKYKMDNGMTLDDEDMTPVDSARK